MGVLGWLWNVEYKAGVWHPLSNRDIDFMMDEITLAKRAPSACIELGEQAQCTKNFTKA